MSEPRRNGWRIPLSLGAVLLLANARAEPAAAEPATEAESASVPLSALKKCAEISVLARRLACYDLLAGREPAPAAPVASVASVASVAPVASAATSGADSAAPAAAKQSFGLYSAEHPQPTAPRAASLTAKVLAIGSGSNGHPLVRLEGNQVWELDAADPLLGTGDTVTINRGLLGSFVMTTSAGRIHRLRRIH